MQYIKAQFKHFFRESFKKSSLSVFTVIYQRHMNWAFHFKLTPLYLLRHGHNIRKIGVEKSHCSGVDFFSQHASKIINSVWREGLFYPEKKVMYTLLKT